MPYYVGQAVRLANWTGPSASPTGGYRDQTNALYDPSTPTLRYQLPGDSAVTVSGGSLTKDAVGLYHQIVTLTKPGDALYAWSSNDGAYATAGFRIEPAPL